MAPLKHPTRSPGEATDTDPASIASDLPDLIEAAHQRVRGMRAVVVTTMGPDGPTPCAAVRSAPGSSESTDFTKLWCLALEAAEGGPSHTLAELIRRSKIPMDERMERAYPGVQLAGPSGDSLHGEYSLYARGETAVRQLAALLSASIDAWPEPDWAAQVQRETFLREVFRAHCEGRTDDLQTLIDDFTDADGQSPESTE
ncbi:hypothetical protein ACIQU4_27505 [Streptomyces sp. NPDC090741]|uniref:hypothetical protein n=1 Tax=Streptomyces sp. NPDC090741 TaxID=3365967 RepID=UPI0037FE6BCB